ncbi:hypothetical protein F4810DRAFT_596847 [Camillea tinctor]|nr:hypothetical protein F4810DRAFT_596847 [Camillea tinctor]
MGRKPVPQPLSLAGENCDSLGQPAISTLTSPDSTVLGAPNRPSPSPSPSPRPAALGPETTTNNLQVISPVSSRSPKSPRSPFSKFNSSSSSAAAAAANAAVRRPPTQSSSQAQPLHIHHYQQQPSLQYQEPQVQLQPPPPPQPPQLQQQQQQQQQPQHQLQQPQQQSQIPRTPQPYPHHQPVEVPRQPLQAADDVLLAQRRRQNPHQNPDFPLATSPGLKHSATTPIFNEPYSRPPEEKHARNTSRFFNFGKASRSTQQLQLDHTESVSEGMSRGADHSAMPDRVPSKASKHSVLSLRFVPIIDQSSIEPPNQRPAPSRSDVSLPSTVEQEHGSSKKNKQKNFALLGRNKSFKDKDGTSPKEPITIEMPESDHFLGPSPLRTAPVNPEAYDRSFRHMMNSTPRNHSADRVPRDTSSNKDRRNDKDSRGPSLQSAGSSFFGGLKSSGSRAADMISKGLFGKGGRSASTSEKEPTVDDEHYVLKVINLPLVEQTRKTRISKRLEESRDKTEFWMPAFPWRAIDYLNFNGTDVEGLYRVPGSGPQIKKWQRKFDEEYDVDLFAQNDLYDINIIGSMLKAWLRELPDELFPKEAQERISRECAGAEEVPQMLIDELSNLSPFNYYLLFAITCHLSLLLAHSDKNKMDFRNLCICFQPCMKIDAFCFKFLVCDWRLCWQGCRNEARYIEEEYMLFQQPLPRGLTADTRGFSGRNSNDDRNVSSSDSSKQSPQIIEPPNGRLRKKAIASGQSNGSVTSKSSTGSASLTVSSEQETPRQRAGELRPLSPIKPLSPLGF